MQKAPLPRQIPGADGSIIATAKPQGKHMVLKLDTSDGFDDWLITHLGEIHRDLLRSLSPAELRAYAPRDPPGVLAAVAWM